MRALLLAVLLAAPAAAQVVRVGVPLRAVVPGAPAISAPGSASLSAPQSLPSGSLVVPSLSNAPSVVLPSVVMAAPASAANAALPKSKSEVAALRVENEALRQRLAEQERIVSQTVHDLRNPLTPIDGFAQLLDMSPLNENQKRHVGKIRAAATRMNAMLQDLLDFSKAQGAPLESQPVDAGLLVRAAAGAVEAAAAKRGIRVELALEDGVVVPGDEALLRRVVENLASNGVKYNRDGGTLRVSSRRVPGGVELSFSDEGIGIKAEDQAKVFTPFYRTAAAKSAASGNGLGLSSVKAAVERHGGRVTVESEPGRGTTFRVFLPA